jgi:hypothetical protein
MSIDKEPLSPILVRFQQDLQLNRRGERTQQSYVRNVRGIPPTRARFRLRSRPAKLSPLHQERSTLVC